MECLNSQMYFLNHFLKINIAIKINLPLCDVFAFGVHYKFSFSRLLVWRDRVERSGGPAFEPSTRHYTSTFRSVG